ncbi:MAG: Long-chain-fatty-acid--CoA ligase FadD15 [Turneriella sp.]|nr:Long-chain-fatty-acid--CoA ligase FadD15 [Turneriella sp.]
MQVAKLNVNTYVEAIEQSFKNNANHLALRYREGGEDFKTMTYAELEKEVRVIAAGLAAIGVKPKDHVGLIADVGHHWTSANLAIQLNGAADVPRGTDSTGPELAYIIDHSGADIVLVYNGEQVKKIEAGLKKYKHKVKKYIVLNSDHTAKGANIMTLNDLKEEGEALIKKGGKALAEFESRASKVSPSDLSCLVYTSGTTGEPKGVMLTHGNFASQMRLMPTVLGVGNEDSGLTLLPPWHVFGRIAEMMFISVGASLTYTDIKHIGEDLRAVKPTYVPAVPRIWEGVYNKIIGNVKKQGKEPIFNKFKTAALKFNHYTSMLTGKEKRPRKRSLFSAIGARIVGLLGALLWFIPKKLGDVLVFKKVLAATGGNLKASISGGGALPSYIDDFFRAIGVRILEGYGLTETSPVLSIRLPNRLIPGTVGPLVAHTEYKLIDLEGNDVTKIPGAKGTLHVRGPQVMQGYYKNPKKTAEVLTPDGWFNTGDLVIMNHSGEISIVGRSKDTLVLVGGENVEPTPIEEKMKESPFIDHVMLVSRAFGEDQKVLGGLIVPNLENLGEWCKANGVGGNPASWIKDAKVNALYRTEINKYINAENGFKNFEKVGVFALLPKPFEQGDELNNTLKVKRHVVNEKYHKLIDEMYKAAK